MEQVIQLLWLYDEVDQKWHVWTTRTPADGDPASCGNPKDADCKLQSPNNSTVRCQDCIDALPR